MSTKTVRLKRSPRAMPMETIITRFKSAQQKQKEDHKQTNISKSIQSIKQNQASKANLPKFASKCVKKIEKNKKEKDEPKSKEFYPDKKKRVFNKRIFLVPKPCLKVIAGTNSSNKRKLYIPRKDIQHSTKRKKHHSTFSTSGLDSKRLKDNTENSTELSVSDMILLIEDEGSLDDEDLLEILTCPSPVWWEDPPDGYIEESIFSREKSVERISVKNQLLEENKKEAESKRGINVEEGSNLDVSKLNISIINRDETFINKRCKLESLLGGIRNKIYNRVDTGTAIRNKIRIKTPEDINGQSFEHNNNTSNLKSDLKPFEGTQEKYFGSFNDHNFLDLADEEIYSLENIEIPIAPADEISKSNDSLLDDNENDSRKQKIVEDLNIKSKALSTGNNKKRRIISDEICIDLSSDSSNDNFTNDHTIEIQKASVKEDTDRSNSINRAFENVAKKSAANNISSYLGNTSKSMYIKVAKCGDDVDLKQEIPSIVVKEYSNIPNDQLSKYSNRDIIKCFKGNIKHLIQNTKTKNHVMLPKDEVEYDKDTINILSTESDKSSNYLFQVENKVGSKPEIRKSEDIDVQKIFDSSFSPLPEIKTSSNESYGDLNISKDRSRKNSTTSYDSDKNMSEEYLDMSIFEDYDEKVEQVNKIIVNGVENHTKKENYFPTSENSVTQTINGDKEEYVAVYKIICNDSDNDDNLSEMEELNKRTDDKNIVMEKLENYISSDKVNGKLDSYYKQRKSGKKYNKQSVDVCTNKKDCISCNYENKSIIISESETIKYCLRCSSIFDTEECKYCIGKSSKQCPCKGDFRKYVCDICDLKLHSKRDIIRHLKKHGNNLTSAWDHIYS